MPKTRSIIPAERIEKVIFLIRGQKVILDKDLADLYEVTGKCHDIVYPKLKIMCQDIVYPSQGFTESQGGN